MLGKVSIIDPRNNSKDCTGFIYREEDDLDKIDVDLCSGDYKYKYTYPNKDVTPITSCTEPKYGITINYDLSTSIRSLERDADA